MPEKEEEAAQDPKESEPVAEETQGLESSSTVSKSSLRRSHSRGRSVLKRAKSRALETEKAKKFKRGKSTVALNVETPPPGNSEEPNHETKRKAPAEENTKPARAKRTAAKSKSQKPEEESTLKPKDRRGKNAEVKPKEPKEPKGKPSHDTPSGSTESTGEKEKQHQRKEAQEFNEARASLLKHDSHFKSQLGLMHLISLYNHHRSPLIFAGIQLQGPPKRVCDVQCPERSSSRCFPCKAGTSEETRTQ